MSLVFAELTDPSTKSLLNRDCAMKPNDPTINLRLEHRVSHDDRAKKTGYTFKMAHMHLSRLR